MSDSHKGAHGCTVGVGVSEHSHLLQDIILGEAACRQERYTTAKFADKKIMQ